MDWNAFDGIWKNILYADTAHFLLIFSEAVTRAAHEQQFYLQVGIFLRFDSK